MPYLRQRETGDSSRRNGNGETPDLHCNCSFCDGVKSILHI